jgi:hypothetical protein
LIMNEALGRSFLLRQKDDHTKGFDDQCA